MIAVVDAFNAAEAAGVSMSRETGGSDAMASLLRHEFETARYSIEWDSEAERWTLVGETDDVIDVCSFNQTRDECREIDPCEQCMQVQDLLADEYDSTVANAWYGR